MQEPQLGGSPRNHRPAIGSVGPDAGRAPESGKPASTLCPTNTQLTKIAVRSGGIRRARGGTSRQAQGVGRKPRGTLSRPPPQRGGRPARWGRGGRNGGGGTGRSRWRAVANPFWVSEKREGDRAVRGGGKRGGGELGITLFFKAGGGEEVPPGDQFEEKAFGDGSDKQLRKIDPI